MTSGHAVRHNLAQQNLPLLTLGTRVVHATSCNSFTAQRPMRRQLQHSRRYAAHCAATSEGGQAQESVKRAADAGELFSELADACTELKRAPPSMVCCCMRRARDTAVTHKQSSRLLCCC
jgi:hypothetical protein